MARPASAGAPKKKKKLAATAPLPDPARFHGLSGDDLRRLYRAMLRVRAVDERMMTLQRQGRIGFYGAATGQEAAVIGSGAALRGGDWVFPALREGGVALLRGYSLDRYVAQCFGNSGDVTKGRQMPSHYADASVRFVSWSSCIGTQLPHAVGMAAAARIKKSSDIAIAYMGDGATSEGDFHVAMNFAGAWKAPVVFFCQNNQFAISVPVSRQTASETIAVKAKAYGFPGVRVDGNDLLAVYAATKEAADRARNGLGPTLVEALTYRIGAHSSSDDPSRYRDETVTSEWKTKRDPIARFRETLKGEGLWSEADERAARTEYESEIAAAVERVEKLPPPEPETLFDDVFAEIPWHLASQKENDLASRRNGHAS